MAEVSVDGQIEALEKRIKDLVRKVNLMEARGVVEDVESRVRELPLKIEQARARGYRFRAFLEQQADVLTSQWKGLASRVYAEIEQQADALKRELPPVERRVKALCQQWESMRDQVAGHEGAPSMPKGQAPAGGVKAGPKAGEQSPLAKKSLKPAPGKKTLKDATERKTLGASPGMMGTLGGAADPGDIRAEVDEVGRAVDSMENKVEAAVDTAKSMFETLSTNVDQAYRLISEINWTMDQVEEATFDFIAGENPVVVAKAEWHADDEKPDGILYLTDQRLMFEQKEKKGGFLGIGRKKVQELGWEVPVNQIEEARSYHKGMLGHRDMVELQLGSGAPYAQLVFEVKGADNDWWIRQINRVRTGDMLNEQVGSEGQSEVDLSEVPSACPNCGGLLPEVMRGQQQLTCEYCSTVIRF